jgi:TRAP-type uncharacterized transport system substrate-binding protein
MSTETTKKFIFTITDKEEGIDVNFDSFEHQELMTSADASMIMLALTRMMIDSGLAIEDIDQFLSNIGEAAKELYKEGGIDITETLEEVYVEDPEIEEIDKTEG